VILVLAGRGIASALQRMLRSDGRTGVSVLSPAGLSVPGWAHDPEHPEGDRIVIAGQVCQPTRLTGVVTALDAVLPGDLPHVTVADRGFVATEMTGFLRDWLATLPCPVIDRPTTLALSGRAADRAAWSAAAAALGIGESLGAPVPVARITTVTVAADWIVSPVPAPGKTSTTSSQQVNIAALALARTARVTAARLMFAGEPAAPVLVGALPWWHVPSPLTLRALLARIGESARTGTVAMAGPAPVTESARLPDMSSGAAR
jgi:ribosomal protein L18E